MKVFMPSINVTKYFGRKREFRNVSEIKILRYRPKVVHLNEINTSLNIFELVKRKVPLYLRAIENSLIINIMC